MYDLDFAMKTTQTESVCFLAILQVEKRWAKVKTSAVAYSLIVSGHFQLWTRPHHEATTLHEVTTLQASLPTYLGLQ